MKALILAAGLGERIGGAADRPPKCLLSFGGTSLLERHVDNLCALGIDEIVVGVGYRAASVRHSLAKGRSVARIRTVFNSAYALGSIVTLWHMRDALRCGDSVLVMDADVLYDTATLGRLVRSHHQNCLLLDRNFEAGDEPVKACIRNDRLVELRKKVSCRYDYCGESVGFFKLSPNMARELAWITEQFMQLERASAPHEEALRELILTSKDVFGFEDITGLPWIEIDFPEDITRAEAEILPKLQCPVRIAS